MEPDFTSGFSGLNFIWEMKDFKSLVKLFQKTSPVLKGMSEARRKTMGSRPFSSSAKIWLTKQFAVEPLIRDLKTIVELHAEMNDRLRKFNHQGSERNVHHSSKVLSEVNTVSPTHDSYYRTYRRTRATFRAQAELQYSQWFDGYWDYFAATYGMNVTLETIWDAIPWSFVVDYFMSVGGFLEAIGKSRPTHVHISQYSETIELEDTIVKCVAFGNSGSQTVEWVSAGIGSEGFGLPVGADVPVASAQRFSYTRTPGVMYSSYPLPEVHFPAYDQVINLIAMWASRKNY
jgi:hypothetical protein